MLFLLKPTEDSRLRSDSPWDPWYDKAFAFVVRAADESEARELASEDCGDEGREVWLDSTITSCDVLDSNGPSHVICRDYASA